MSHIDLNDYPALMAVEEVASFLRIGKQTVYAIAKEKDFPVIMAGGKMRIVRDKLMDWLETNSSHREKQDNKHL